MEDKERTENLEYYYNLLDEVCIGLRTSGYHEHGGSLSFRCLSKGQGEDTKSIKAYLNNYEIPTGIIVRYS